MHVSQWAIVSESLPCHPGGGWRRGPCPMPKARTNHKLSWITKNWCELGRREVKEARCGAVGFGRANAAPGGGILRGSIVQKNQPGRSAEGPRYPGYSRPPPQ